MGVIISCRRCREEQVDQFGNKSIQNLCLRVDPRTQWVDANMLRQGISL